MNFFEHIWKENIMRINIFEGILIPFVGTTLGAACVFFMRKTLSKLLQRALAGFAAGIMVAASIWSLLIPAIKQSENMGTLSFVPAVAGLWIGILFLLALDHLIPHLHVGSDQAEGPKSKLGRKMIGLKFGCLHCSGAPFPIVSCLLLYRKGHKSEMQKQESRAKIRAISCKSEL